MEKPLRPSLVSFVHASKSQTKLHVIQSIKVALYKKQVDVVHSMVEAESFIMHITSNTCFKDKITLMATVTFVLLKIRKVSIVFALSDQPCERRLALLVDSVSQSSFAPASL
jgi:hypothetical protein